MSKSPMNRSFNRFERLYMNVDQQQAKISALKNLYEKESILKDIETCTFQPNINKPQEFSNSSGVDVVERNYNWMKYKQSKIQHMQREKEQKEKKD